MRSCGLIVARPTDGRFHASWRLQGLIMSATGDRPLGGFTDMV
jgi:hypothetical protein